MRLLPAPAAGFVFGLSLLPGWFLHAESSVPHIQTLEARTLHLGIPGQIEWQDAHQRPVVAEHLEIHFDAAPNPLERTLRIRHRGVKLAWPLLLNGRKLGTLTRDEALMESVFSVPAYALHQGDNLLSLIAPPGLDDIEAGPVQLVDAPPSEALGGASVEIEVTDAADGSPLPCRLTLTQTDGTLQPLRAAPSGDVAARTGVVYTRAGRARLTLPPGNYRLHAGRGMEWSVASLSLALSPGENPVQRIPLSREVSTEGWIAVDSHIHTLTHSRHGDATLPERLITIAGEGIELAVATDHNHHADYAPVAADLNLARRFTPVIGNEVTTKRGHFNAFPVNRDAPVLSPAEEDWTRLLPAIRNIPGVRVVTLNHPRDLHSGFTPFGPENFNPVSGSLHPVPSQAAALRIDAIEVLTSGALQSDIGLLFRDWFALLNNGHRMAAIASSDTHDVSRFILGQGRTYVAATDTEPGNLPLEEIWKSYASGRLLVSMGLFANLRVNGHFAVGDLASGLGNTLEVEATVSGPSWTRADHVALYANGQLLREESISAEHQTRPGQKARILWRIPKPARDAHLVLIATGPGVTEPFWEIPRPYQPSTKQFTPRVLGATNPIWLDADGDGRFESAADYARALLKQHGTNSTTLEQALSLYDASVAIQLRALLETQKAQPR